MSALPSARSPTRPPSSAAPNEVYVGERIWNKHSRTGDRLPKGKKAMRPNPESEWIRMKDYTTPTVERSVWDAVQARLAADKIVYNKHHVANTGRQFLLSGLWSDPAVADSWLSEYQAATSPSRRS